MVKASVFGTDTAGSNPAALATERLLDEVVQMRREYNQAVAQAYKDFPDLWQVAGSIEKFLIEEKPRVLVDLVYENMARAERGLKMLKADAEALGITLPKMPS